MKLNYYFILLTLFLLFGCSQKNNFSLTDNRKSDYTIVIPEDAAGSIKKAASELQIYFEKISDVRLPVTTSGNAKTSKIFVGKPDENLPSEHTVLIKVEDNNLIITGRNTEEGSLAKIDERTNSRFAGA